MIPAVRFVVLLAWAVMMAISGYALTQLQLGLEQQLVLPQGSYLKDYFDDQGGWWLRNE